MVNGEKIIGIKCVKLKVYTTINGALKNVNFMGNISITKLVLKSLSKRFFFQTVRVDLLVRLTWRQYLMNRSTPTRGHHTYYLYKKNFYNNYNQEIKRNRIKC